MTESQSDFDARIRAIELGNERRDGTMDALKYQLEQNNALLRRILDSLDGSGPSTGLRGEMQSVKQIQGMYNKFAWVVVTAIVGLTIHTLWQVVSQ